MMRRLRSIHLVGSAGCLEYLTIANIYLFINNKLDKAGFWGFGDLIDECRLHVRLCV